MTYAVIDLGGNQVIIEPGKFYDINYIPANPGDIISFKRVLFLSQSNKYHIGTPCLNNVLVKATVLKHLQGKKIQIFKVKPKKNSRIKKGYRKKLTRILVEDILS
uniref:50S ribosomal protein L21, chloroplastic n=1 Tax=Pleurostichidium falkenbergii TaxID=121064 RepID=A0A4D6UYG6_9FLOR|nr:ribosomal protein L21 [Pleurostichidium falkenbergii]QCH39584.1 ribosomal protein L21 [Pleurostichidium falkenbergii]